jgi:hypothetical protein
MKPNMSLAIVGEPSSSYMHLLYLGRHASCSWGKPRPDHYIGETRQLFMGETTRLCSTWGNTPVVHGGLPKTQRESQLLYLGSPQDPKGFASCSTWGDTPVVHGGNPQDPKGFVSCSTWGDTPVVHGGNPQDHTGSPRPH